jgi:hypothetical protein
MNAMQLKMIADKTRRGLRGRVEAGCSGGGISYGYATVFQVGPDGMPVRGLRRIDPDEAAVVRRNYEAFAAGRSGRRIAHDLNAEGVPAPGGRSWGASTISGNVARGTGILNNELYLGRIVWNKLRYLKDPDTGRRVSRLNDPAQWVVKEVPELRIIDPDLWDRVKARQETMRCDTRPDVRARPCDRRRPRYLLSGLIVCGACGGSYTKISANLFGCAAARNKGAPSAPTSETSGGTGSRRRSSMPCGTTSWTPSCFGSSVRSTCARPIGCAGMGTPGATGCARS